MLIVYDSLINEVNTSVEVYTSILCNNKGVFFVYTRDNRLRLRVGIVVAL